MGAFARGTDGVWGFISACGVGAVSIENSGSPSGVISNVDIGLLLTRHSCIDMVGAVNQAGDWAGRKGPTDAVISIETPSGSGPSGGRERVLDTPRLFQA